MATEEGSTSLDRFGVTLLFALIVHAVVALGVTFDFESVAPSLPTLDVILVQISNAEKPTKADFLAQANNRGGGSSEQARRPTQTLSSLIPSTSQGIAPLPLESAAPRPSPAAPVELLTQRHSSRHEVTHQEHIEKPETHAAEEREIEQRQLEMAQLAEEVQQKSEQYAKRPRRKYVSANTQEYAYASYMSAWVARIKRVGNLNYPDEARRQQLHGELLLTVGLARDGSIKSVDVIQSSGHKVLDDAAVRIVHLAAPFAPLPKTDDVVDELYITRTWQFLPGDLRLDH